MIFNKDSFINITMLNYKIFFVNLVSKYNYKHKNNKVRDDVL